MFVEGTTPTLGEGRQEGDFKKTFLPTLTSNRQGFTHSTFVATSDRVCELHRLALLADWSADPPSNFGGRLG